MALSRKAKWWLSAVSISVALPIVAVVALFASISGASEDEVSRVASPDGRWDAVLVETNGGATTSYGYLVYVTHRAERPKASPVASLYGTVRSPTAYGANLRWVGTNQLTVEFLDTELSKLISPKISVAGQEIVIKLQPGILDPKAPSGGMLYNLRGRQ